MTQTRRGHRAQPAALFVGTNLTQINRFPHELAVVERVARTALDVLSRDFAGAGIDHQAAAIRH